MDWSEILAFSFIAFLLVISPGPNGVLVAKTVPISGRAAGFANVAGFVSAFYLHGTLSILGISIILVNSAVAFAIVKYLGAAYLCWIGLKALWSAFRDIETEQKVTPSTHKRTLISAFAEGALTNALNPKVSMFYLAAFPQFISVGENPVASGFLLVFIHSMINAIWFAAMVVLFARLSLLARSNLFQRWLKGLTGVVFLGFGAKLATYKPDL